MPESLMIEIMGCADVMLQATPHDVLPALLMNTRLPFSSRITAYKNRRIALRKLIKSVRQSSNTALNRRLSVVTPSAMSDKGREPSRAEENGAANLPKPPESSDSTSTRPWAQGPDARSRYVRNEEVDRLTQLPELYSQGQSPIYNKGPRGVDPNPYKIHTVLGDGQYHLERNGQCDGKVYQQENLQTEP